MGAMASTNKEVAALLREYADLLGLTGGDPFRARNYERAAKAVAGYPADLATLPDKALTTIDGVGPSIAAKIAECRRTGTFAALEELRAKIPPGVRRAGQGAGRRPQARAAARPRARVSPARPSSPRPSGAAGCAAWPGSAPRPRSASCAASTRRRATPRCARRCARSRTARAWTTSTRCSPPSCQRPASATAEPGGRRAHRGPRTSAATCTRTPTSPTASSPSPGCSPPRKNAATRTTRSPTTRRTWSCSG